MTQKYNTRNSSDGARTWLICQVQGWKQTEGSEILEIRRKHYGIMLLNIVGRNFVKQEVYKMKLLMA